MRKLIIILITVPLLLCGCVRPDNFNKDYLDDTTQRIVVGGKVLLKYEPLTCQRSVDSSRKSYRIFKDDLSVYYSVSLGSLPATTDQLIENCTVKWTGSDKIYTLSGATLKVKSINADNLVWLWDEADDLVIVLQLL